MRAVHGAFLLLVAGCTKDGGDTDASGDLADRFDLAADPDCEAYTDDESGEETPVPGATSYFVGEFEWSGEDVTGVEQWVLFANDAWREAMPEADDCVITWLVTGIVTEPARCGSCDYGLVMHAVMDLSASDCVDGLIDATRADSEEMDLSYDVAVNGDGDAIFYFGGSGDQLGTGVADDGSAAYATSSACKWF